MRVVTCLALLAATALAAEPVQAHGRHGRWWGGVSLGIGVPLYIGPWYAVPVSPAVLPPEGRADMPLPPARTAPDPIFYPRQGQSAEQLESDRQACNRWATTQPSAMADASVFHRATLACMDGRGYTAR